MGKKLERKTIEEGDWDGASGGGAAFAFGVENATS